MNSALLPDLIVAIQPKTAKLDSSAVQIGSSEFLEAFEAFVGLVTQNGQAQNVPASEDFANAQPVTRPIHANGPDLNTSAPTVADNAKSGAPEIVTRSKQAREEPIFFEPQKTLGDNDVPSAPAESLQPVNRQGRLAAEKLDVDRANQPELALKVIPDQPAHDSERSPTRAEEPRRNPDTLATPQYREPEIVRPHIVSHKSDPRVPEVSFPATAKAFDNAPDQTAQRGYRQVVAATQQPSATTSTPVVEHIEVGRQEPVVPDHQLEPAKLTSNAETTSRAERQVLATHEPHIETRPKPSPVAGAPRIDTAISFQHVAVANIPRADKQQSFEHTPPPRVAKPRDRVAMDAPVPQTPSTVLKADSNAVAPDLPAPSAARDTRIQIPVERHATPVSEVLLVAKRPIEQNVGNTVVVGRQPDDPRDHLRQFAQPPIDIVRPSETSRPQPTAVHPELAGSKQVPLATISLPTADVSRPKSESRQSGPLQIQSDPGINKQAPTPSQAPPNQSAAHKLTDSQPNASASRAEAVPPAPITSKQMPAAAPLIAAPLHAVQVSDAALAAALPSMGIADAERQISSSEIAERADEIVRFSANETTPREVLRPTGDIRMSRFVAAQLVEVAKQLPDRPVEVSLNPAELGKVKMTLTAGDGTMSVVLSVERGETADLLRRNLESLAEEFRSLGYAETSFSFSGGNGEHRGDKDQPGDSPDFPGTNTEATIETQAPMRIMLNGRVDIRI